MIIRGVVFDLDGLMFDTEALFYRVSAELLEERGRKFTPEIMRAMMGRRPPEAGLALVQLSGIGETVDQWLALVRQRFQALLDEAVRPTPGLHALLEELEERAPLAVATSSPRDYALDLLDRHDLLDHFEFILGAEDVSLGKPDPEIYLAAAARLGAASHEIVVLEDSPAGVEAARRAGATVVAVPHEHSPAEGLKGADMVISALDASEFLAYLRQRLPHRLNPRS